MNITTILIWIFGIFLAGWILIPKLVKWDVQEYKKNFKGKRTLELDYMFISIDELVIFVLGIIVGIILCSI